MSYNVIDQDLTSFPTRRSSDLTEQVRLFENTQGSAGNWIQLALAGGTGTNRAAIGARVTIAAGGISQTREIGGGYGHYRSEEHTSELQSREKLVCRLLLEKKKQ